MVDLQFLHCGNRPWPKTTQSRKPARNPRRVGKSLKPRTATLLTGCQNQPSAKVASSAPEAPFPLVAIAEMSRLNLRLLLVVGDAMLPAVMLEVEGAVIKAGRLARDAVLRARMATSRCEVAAFTAVVCRAARASAMMASRTNNCPVGGCCKWPAAPACMGTG